MDLHANLPTKIPINHRKMLDMHRLGCTIEEIAEHCEVLPETVNKNLQKYFTRALDHQRTMVALNTEIDRFDQLHDVFMPEALTKNVDAAKIVLAVHDRRAKVMGLNAPDKLNIAVDKYEEMSDDDIKERIKTIESEMVDVTPTGEEAVADAE